MTAAASNPVGVYQMVGERIRDARRRQNITQDALASVVGLTRTSITNIENGRQKLLLHTLIQIADCLGVSPGDLLGRFEPEHSVSLPGDLPKHVRNWIVHSIGRGTSQPYTK